MNVISTYTNINSNSVPIPNASPIGITSSIEVPQERRGKIHDLRVTIDIEHTYTSDLTIFLIHPQGTKVRLVSGKGGSGDNFKKTEFDDQASIKIEDGTSPFRGTFRPEENLVTFKNMTAEGTWTLRVEDRAAEDGGFLNFWMMSIDIVTEKVTFDKELYRLRLKQLAHLEAAKSALKYVKCVQGNGGFGNVDTLINCMDLARKPVIPLPPVVSSPDVEELLMQMAEDERGQIGSALVEAQDRLLEVLTSELIDIDRDRP